MSYRSERLRKKLKVGELQQRCFLCTGKLSPDVATDPGELVDQVIHYVESQSMCITGGPGIGTFKFYVDGNYGKKLTSADRESFAKFMRSMPSVQSVRVSELRDAWYSDLEDWYNL